MNKLAKTNFLFLLFIIFLNFFQKTCQDESDCSYKKFGSEIQVNTYQDNSQYEPSVCSIGNQFIKFVITWNSDEKDGSLNDIFAQMYEETLTNKSSDEIRVNVYSFLNVAYPSVTSFSLNEQRFVIAWDSFREDRSSFGIFAQIYDSHHGTKVGTEFQVNTNTNSLHRYPAVSPIGEKDENFVIVWWSMDQDLNSHGIFFQRYNGTDRSAIGEEFQVNNFTDDDSAKHPAVWSVGHKGERFVIAWETEVIPDGTKYEISAQLFDSHHGTKIGKEFQVNTYIPGEQRNPVIAPIGQYNERFIIAFSSNHHDGSEYGIFAQMYDSYHGTKIDTEFQVNNYSNNSQQNPSIASLGSKQDKFVITWDSLDQDGSSYGVFAQVFSGSNGSKIGQEFQINTETNSSQEHPSIASFGKKKEKFVITWQSLDQDGSHWGTFAQVFVKDNCSSTSTDTDTDTDTDTEGDDDFEIYHLNSGFTISIFKQALVSLFFLSIVLYFGYF